MLHEAGLVDGYNEGRTQIFRGATAPARFWQATQAMTLARMVAEGVCTEAEAAEFSAAYEDPTFDFVGMTLIATRARRAPDG